MTLQIGYGGAFGDNCYGIIYDINSAMAAQEFPYRIKLNNVNSLCHRIMYWCGQNTTGYWGWGYDSKDIPILCFSANQDAVLFRLSL